MKASKLQLDSAVRFDEVTSLLLPVWIASYRGPKGPVVLMVNGQTGRVAGKLPSTFWRQAGLLLMGAGFLLLLMIGAMMTLMLLPFLLGLLLELAGGAL